MRYHYTSLERWQEIAEAEELSPSDDLVAHQRPTVDQFISIGGHVTRPRLRRWHSRAPFLPGWARALLRLRHPSA